MGSTVRFILCMCGILIFLLLAIVWFQKSNLRASHLRLQSAEGYLNQGNAFALEGKSQQALKAWDEATRIAPDLVEPYIQRGDQFRRLRQFRRAVDQYQAAHRLRSNDLSILFSLIQSLIDAGNYSRIENLARRAVRLDPSNAKSHAYLGTFLGHSNGSPDDLKEAEKELMEAHRLSPLMPVPVIELGRLFSRQNRLKDAKDMLTQAWELLHRGDQTARFLETASEVEKRRAETAYTMGLVCRQIGSGKEMQLWLSRFRDLDRLLEKRMRLQLTLSRKPDDTLALVQLAHMNVETGSTSEAMKIVARVIEIDPYNVEAHKIAEELGLYPTGNDHIQVERGETKKGPP